MLLFLLFAGWLASTISGAAGFGGALLLLPVLAWTSDVKAAVPILTLAQLLGNLSRAWFGREEIRWRPALIFSLGAVPASLVGSRLFVALPSASIQRFIGVFLLVVVVLRHTSIGKQRIAEPWLPWAGAVVGLLSALAGSAGPLGAVVFLTLQLPARAYVATEAVSASLIHLSKSCIYGRYDNVTSASLVVGLALGGSMILGSWTGRKLIDRLSATGFSRLVEGLLIVAAVSMIGSISWGR